jgi:hypothetical protein
MDDTRASRAPITHTPEIGTDEPTSRTIAKTRLAKKEAPMTGKRARNLDDAAIGEIVALLDGWTGPLSWQALIERIDDLMRMRYTRQALNNHERIKLAFYSRRETLRAAGVPVRVRAKSREIAMLLQINARMEAENKRLKHENTRLLEQFARWAYNANSRGVHEAVLNRPLPQVNRDSSVPFHKIRLPHATQSDRRRRAEAPKRQ